MKTKKNLDRKSILIAFRVTPQEMYKIKALSLLHFKGKVSKWIREAALKYRK